MSVSFQGTKYSLDLNNGLACRLLAAMDLPTNSTAGEVDLTTAGARVITARDKVSIQDREYLNELEALIQGLSAAGKTKLEWF